MPLRGELKSVDLAHIFQMLLLNQKAGTLEIAHDSVKCQLYFTADGLLVPFERAVLEGRAVGMLLRHGRLQQSAVERARCNMGVVKKSLFETLREMKVLTAEQATAALKEPLEEDVYELFFLREAHFEFRDGEAPAGSGEIDPELALAPNGLIMEAARRVDEWEYIKTLIASGDDIVEARGSVEALDARERDAEARAIHAALDGFHTVDAVIESTGIARFAVFRKVALFLDKKLAEKVPAADLVQRARTCLHDGRVRAAIPLFERAAALGAAEVGVLAGAGQAYETLGEAARAADRYLEAGRLSESNGDIGAALRLYLRIRELLPTHVEARERLFALREMVQAQLPRGTYDAFAEGCELAEILRELGRREELALVLAGLLDVADDDAVAIEQVSGLAARIGQVASAIDAQQRAAGLRAQARDFEGAVRCLKKAQRLDPSRADFADRIRQLTEEIRLRGVRRRSSIRAVAAAGAALVLFLGYGRYSSAAMEDYAAQSLEDFLFTRDFDAGRAHYRSIVRHFPLTIPFLLSIEKLRELDVAEENSEAVERYRREVETEQSAGDLKQAKTFLEAALNARHGGNYAEAARLLRKAAGLSGKDDPLAIQAAVADVEEYLGAARRLKSEAVFFRNAGRLEQSHARLVELLERFPHSPDAHDVLLPVNVTSDPPRARILVDGEPVRIGDDQNFLEAETPFVLDLPADRAIVIAVAAPGRAALEREVHAKSGSAVHIEIPRQPDLAAILTAELAQPLAADRDTVLAVLHGGRLTALEPTTLAARWSIALPDLAELAAPPAVDAGEILAPLTVNALAVLDARTGTILRQVALPGRASGTPVRCGGRLAVAIDGGRLAAGPGVAGQVELAEVALPAALVAGPVALSSGKFAVACSDGSVWVCGNDGGLAMLRGGAAPAAYTALAAAGDEVLAGDQAGRLHRFDVAGGIETSVADVLGGHAIRSIEVFGARVVVAGGDQLALFDRSAGSVLVRRGAVACLFPGTGEVLAAAESDGLVHVYDRDTLAPVASYAGSRAGAGGAVRCGTSAGDRVYFADEAGRVMGIFCQRR